MNTAFRRLGRAVVAAALVTGSAGCGSAGAGGGGEGESTGADPAVGVTLMREYGCGACHRIPGLREARGEVGPPLDRFAHRVYIAGTLANTPENLVLWIVNPQGVEPGTAMPVLGVNPTEASHIAAYLYSLR